MNIDGACSIETGLELARVIGPVRWACMILNLHIKGGSAGGGGGGGGVPVASSMPKSVSFLRKGKKSTVDGFVIAYLLLGDCYQWLCLCPFGEVVNSYNGEFALTFSNGQGAEYV